MSSLISLDKINKTYGNKQVLKNINFNIREGEFISFVGESGGGKTTLLRLIAGLEKPTSGAITINNKILNGKNNTARVMFQDARLLPWMTVIDNVTFGNKNKSVRDYALELLQKVELAEKAMSYPEQLSGGQKQRVALARALMSRPKILLLDEPLGALDALTRLKMQRLVAKIVSESNLTTILITHDVQEAVLLADRVVAVKNGHLGLVVDGTRKSDTRKDLTNVIETVQNFILTTSEEIK
ncbi:ABC transporter ATP-binding protein [Leuconostoc pseudomesenteroides]|uniref:ATP-binding cassette domain-containing protein n=1 Tax=Leuconostoc pseudomesenteroides TaxID=33968 RepID=UPI00403D9718